ncbi:MAG: thiamine phosphate synthase [Acidobacteria bacterium]|nr:thiamine phosphate synthase [Acidobacteriota bacterium]
MPLTLPRFYPVIDRSIRPDLSLQQIARVLAGAGVRLVQLRAKQASGGALLAEAKELRSLLPPEISLIVNDRADVAQLSRAAGVHLGQDDLPVPAARRLLGPDKLIGFSTHNLEQIEAAASAPVDYLAFGPIFPTATKADTQPVVGCAGLREVRKRTSKPLVAIGGITPANAAQAIEAGADSVAVISGWLAAEDIPARLEEFRSALGRLD